jgi:hypothetical protein
MKQTIPLAFAAVVLAACGSTTTATPTTPEPTGVVFGPFDAAEPMPEPRPMADGRLGPGGGTILRPSSARLQHGRPYQFSLGHCGLHSPVDADGSFWDPMGGETNGGDPIDLSADVEMINATPGVLVVAGDRASFRTDSGTVVTFDRHDGDKEFSGCA